jgi:uncharacterized membrane protein (DUF373 family)
MTEHAGRNQAGKLRLLVARGFTRVEDILYVGLGVLLAGSAAALLVNAAATFGKNVFAGAGTRPFAELLDPILLILMIVELLYTVQVSFREHTLVPEPFLIVGLIAVTRRILVVTAELAATLEKGNEHAFRNAMLELALLTIMVITLVVSLRILRKRGDILASRTPD